jgi:hypothetical protein
MIRSLVAFGLWVSTTAGVASDEARGTNRVPAGQSVDDVVRIDTRAGTFMVRETCAEELRDALAGRVTEHPIYAGR